MDALDALLTRRSIRSYTDKPVSRDLLEACVNAGRMAATARNEQPWQFIVVTDRTKLDALKDINEYADFLATAPACICVFCRADAKYYLEDGSAAIQNILVAARAFGLGSCWIAGDKKTYTKDIAELLDVPDTYRLIGSCAIGHTDGPHPAAPDKKSLDEIIDSFRD